LNIKDLGNSLGNSKIINLIFKPAEANMESRFRQWLYPPLRITLPAATLIGDQGRLIAMDVTSDFITRVSKKVEAANLKTYK
jgi:hypothetical protein